MRVGCSAEVATKQQNKASLALGCSNKLGAGILALRTGNLEQVEVIDVRSIGDHAPEFHHQSPQKYPSPY
ncbi:hypothetical protein EON65_56540 [archaeon]|nr:MAG: hypothetical protein EON65_56540 [archaeon]